MTICQWSRLYRKQNLYCTCKTWHDRVRLSQVKKQQQKITQVLDAKLVAYVIIDVAASEDDKLRMRELMNDETALPPQIFKGDTHLGVSEG